MREKIGILILLLLACYVNAQNYKFGKISKEELQEISYYNDENIHAAVLYRNQRIFFDYVQDKGFIQKNEIHERIKIYSKEGLEYANHKMKFFDDGSDTAEEIIQLKAYTYNLNGNEIEKTKLKKEGVFNEVVNKYWKTKKFTMPNVKEGSVVEYKYTVQSPSLQVSDISFQEMIPIKKLDFKFSAPEFFGYKTLTNLKAKFLPNLKKDTKQRKIKLTNKYRSGYRVTKTHYETQEIDYIENIIYASVSNVPHLKEESFVDNIYNYQSKLVLELEYTKFPNEPMDMLSSDWEKVAKTIYNNSHFGNQLNKESYYKKDLENLLQGVTNDDEKIARILKHLKRKVKWNNIGGYYTDLGVSKAYDEHTGNIADINLALVSMMRYAGFKANPILVSTKSNGIPLFPTRTGFNYVVCGVELNGKMTLLDATQPYATKNIIPIKAINWLGRLIRKDGKSEWVDLIPDTYSLKKRLVSFDIDANLSVSGKSKSSYSKYLAYSFRNSYSNLNEESLIKKIEEGNTGLTVSKPKIEQAENLKKPVVLNYEFEYQDGIEEVGNKLYLSPLFFMVDEENEFKEDKRNYPIDFSYPFSEKIMVNVKLPAGYIVESLPEQAKFVCANIGEYSFLLKQNGSTIQLLTNFKLSKSIISPEEYTEFKKFYQMYIDKQLEKIVLTKQ